MTTGSMESRAGRPVVTSHEEIERAAFELFEEHGYEASSMVMIADRVGIGTRTVFRYFPSKHDIAWGRFDRELPRLREVLAEADPSMGTHEAVLHSLVAFNRFAADSAPSHVARMRLIIREPSLQAHSAQRYVEWRSAIEEFVASRRGERPGDPVPRLAAFATNALAIAAYTRWVDEPELSLADLFVEAGEQLKVYLST